MKKPSRPARQVCPLCAIDDEVELTSEGPDMWVFVCHRGHPAQPYQWTPTAHTVAPPGRTAVGDDLGVYEALLACVQGDERVEYGVVEYRYAEQSPADYAKLVEKYGHRSLGETVYSASVFLAHALGQLEREGLLEKSWVPGSGYWSYLDRVSAWSQPGTDAASEVSTWASFAVENDLDPHVWTPIA